MRAEPSLPLPWLILRMMQQLMHVALPPRWKCWPPSLLYVQSILPPKPALPQLLWNLKRHLCVLCRKLHGQLLAGLVAARQLHALDPRPAGFLQAMRPVNVTLNEGLESPTNVNGGRGAFLRLLEGICVTDLCYMVMLLC